MSDQLISIPFKSTTELDLNEPISKYFTKSLGIKDKTKLSTACLELNRLRSVATNKNIEKSPIGLQLISRYADQIRALIFKIPVSSEILNLQFTWEDSLDRGTLFSAKKAATTLPILTFEHLCILFNVASLQSQLGADQRFADTDEELKSVAKWFQSAAGIFEHIATHVGTTALPIPATQTLTTDLNPDVLNALASLMLAQAQEMILKKAIRDSMKDGILAKLCIQTEELYNETMIKMTKDAGIKNQWDKAWISNISAKQLLYSGLAQYFQAAVAGTGKRIGEQIARLNLCIESLKKSQDKLKSCTTTTHYLNEATRIVTDVKKENDFIYHEIIPESKSLSPVEKVASARLAKVIPVPEQLSMDFIDIFADLEIEKHNQKEEAPLKAAIDASIHAAGYYMNKLFSGKKSK